MHTGSDTATELTIDHAVLTRVVRRALGHEAAAVEQWRVSPAGASRGAATAGVYRVSGTARTDGALQDWAVILKLIRPAAAAFNPAARDEGHPIYWKREVLAYQSGLLDDLPGGVAAPHCLAVEERVDETCWLWLEELQDGDGARWPLAQYARAARALGRFNGAYLVERPIPDAPWIGSPGSLRGLLEAFRWMQDVIQNPATWQHPLVRSTFPPSSAARLRRMWQQREPLLAALERVPRVLCHKDAFRRNMFLQPPGAGQPELVLIDWAYLGCGELGLDIADLYGASAAMCCVATNDLAGLDGAIFEGYLTGLADAGWQGDDRLVRLSFTTAAALKYAGIQLWLADVADAQRSAAWEQLSGQPLESFAREQAALVSQLLDMVDEAHALLRTIDTRQHQS